MRLVPGSRLRKCDRDVSTAEGWKPNARTKGDARTCSGGIGKASTEASSRELRLQREGTALDIGEV